MRQYKISALILCMLIMLTSYTACAPKEEQQTASQPTESTPRETLSISYDMPEYGTSKDILNNAVYEFRKTHPDVQINITRPARPEKGDVLWDEYYAKLNTEIMAGKGADLVFFYTNAVEAYKMMKAGAFTDLAPFMEADPDFPWDDCNRAVIEGARYKGCQYMMPINYELPFLLSEKSLLEEAGVRYEDCTNFESIWAELADYCARYSENEALPKPLYSRWRFWRFTSFIGIPWLDIENQTVDLSDERWPELFEQYRTICASMPDKELEQENQYGGKFDSPVKMMEGEYLHELYYGDAFCNLILNLRTLSTLGEPYLIPIYDVNGGIQAGARYVGAIRRNSSSQQLAYDFIKVMLSPEIQKLSNSIAPTYIPVSNSALKQSLQEAEKELTEEIYFSRPIQIPDPAPVPHVVTQTIWDATQNIDGVYYWTECYRQFYNSMEPYLEGKMTYEDAIKDAEETLSIYVSE